MVLARVVMRVLRWAVWMEPHWGKMMAVTRGHRGAALRVVHSAGWKAYTMEVHAVATKVVQRDL